jgi:hypothetical protein
MKSFILPITAALLLSGCADGMTLTIVGDKDDKPIYAINGITHYDNQLPPYEAAIKRTNEQFIERCPKGVVVISKAFKAEVVPNWVGIEYLEWSGPVQCK